LCNRYVVAVNDAIGVHVVAEGRTVYRLVRVALHRCDVISVNQAVAVYVAEEDSHWYRNVTAAAYSDQVGRERLGIAYISEVNCNLGIINGEAASCER
jgi:hypothetical protein